MAAEIAGDIHSDVGTGITTIGRTREAFLTGVMPLKEGYAKPGRKIRIARTGGDFPEETGKVPERKRRPMSNGPNGFPRG